MNLQISGLKVDAGGGPGSRGGKIIGHTKSGKPIYMSHKHPSHGDFTKQEHSEAAKLHKSESKKLGKLLPDDTSTMASVEKKRIYRMGDLHNWAANFHAKKAGEFKKPPVMPRSIPGTRMP